jgi:hypothetical protein
MLCPRTGRRHQLRVHSCDVGHRIAGDYTYSSGQDSNTSRMFLHAQRLVLPNRVEHLDVECPESFEPGSTYAEKQVLRDANEAYAMLDQECDVSWKCVT